MRNPVISCVVLAVATAWPALTPAHEMFLKSEGYALDPDSEQVIRLLNGTFDISENSIDRARMRDVSIVAHGQTTKPAASDWYDDEDGTTSFLKYRTGRSGTYVIGVSTAPSRIEMQPDAFVSYLRHEGVLDTLAGFEKSGWTGPVREQYSKHVRAIVQVGDTRTADHSTRLGYPVEIIPEQNPYDLRFGKELTVQVLLDGKPLPNQPLRAGYEGFHGHDESGEHISAIQLRTDADGKARLLLSNKAIWYLTLIHMQPVDDAEVDFVSHWATLTFTVK